VLFLSVSSGLSFYKVVVASRHMSLALTGLGQVRELWI
jgi:hypothetical protein